MAGHEVFFKESVCEMPDVPHLHVKDMASFSIKVRANGNHKVGTGGVIGYLSYKDGERALFITCSTKGKICCICSVFFYALCKAKWIEA